MVAFGRTQPTAWICSITSVLSCRIVRVRTHNLFHRKHHFHRRCTSSTRRAARIQQGVALLNTFRPAQSRQSSGRCPSPGGSPYNAASSCGRNHGRFAGAEWSAAASSPLPGASPSAAVLSPNNPCTMPSSSVGFKSLQPQLGSRARRGANGTGERSTLSPWPRRGRLLPRFGSPRSPIPRSFRIVQDLLDRAYVFRCRAVAIGEIRPGSAPPCL